MEKTKFKQPEFILEKIATKNDGKERMNVYVVKNISFNVKPMFVKGGIYTVKDCIYEEDQTCWINSKTEYAICADAMNSGRNMIIVFTSMEERKPEKEKTLINKVLVALKIKKQKLVVPPMPQQILVQLVGTLAGEDKNA